MLYRWEYVSTLASTWLVCFRECSAKGAHNDFTGLAALRI